MASCLTDSNLIDGGLYRDRQDMMMADASSTPLQHLHERVHQLGKLDNRTCILPDNDVNKAKEENVVYRSVNSLVFSTHRQQLNQTQTPPSPPESENRYIVAIVSDHDRVDVSLLQQAIRDHVDRLEPSDAPLLEEVELTPSDQLVDTCGFHAGTVPPIGLSPAPWMTFVDHSLLQRPSKTAQIILLGGGGTPDQTLVVPLDILLNSDDSSVHVAPFRQRRLEPNTNAVSPNMTDETIMPPAKPFFAVAPPPCQRAQQVVEQASASSSAFQDVSADFPSEAVTLVGTISGLRQMARRLLFADLAPPSWHLMADTTITPTNDELTHPWRNPTDPDQDMAAQLVLGKTICQKLGEDACENQIKELKRGDLVLVHGRTGVDNLSHLRNWVSKTSLDIIVSDIQILKTANGAVSLLGWNHHSGSANSKLKDGSTKGKTTRSRTNNNGPCLTLPDVFPGQASKEISVVLVDDLESATRFQNELFRWTEEHPGNEETMLVGIDCEWKPQFLQTEHDQTQPVLLLQICLYSLQQVYLLDLQSLLTPLKDPTESKTDIEISLSASLGKLWKSPNLLKVGFQLVTDFQRLAQSYPILSELQVVKSVLDVAQMGRKSIQMAKEGTGRDATSSLSKLVQRMTTQPLNKDQQVSDWSIRPLTKEQIDYSALDAAVTPFLANRLMTMARSTLRMRHPDYRAADNSTPFPEIVRCENDSAFRPYLTNHRFHLLPPTDTLAAQRLHGKLLIVIRENEKCPYLVSQRWLAGQDEPGPPTVPTTENGPYTDLFGITRVPSQSIHLQPSSPCESMVGGWTGKSKEICVMEMIAAAPGDNAQTREFVEGGLRLEFNHRSGYIELANAVALFVTLPVGGGGNKYRSHSYPNEWLQNGAILTWFIKRHEWNNGNTPLAQKMMNDDETTIMLFVRRGKGHFLCCGRCRMATMEDVNGTIIEENTTSSDQWNIMKQYLWLEDFARLEQSGDFQDIVSPQTPQRRPQRSTAL